MSVTPEGPQRCLVAVGSDDAHQLALHLGLLDVDFEVLDPPELAAAFHRLAQRYHRAARRGQAEAGTPDAQP